MKKEYLKTGMRITQRNGKTAIVLLGTTKGDIVRCIGGHGTWYPLSTVTFNTCSVYDIVKVEDSSNNAGDLFKYYALVWSETEELTMKQLEKELGRKIKIVK